MEKFLWRDTYSVGNEEIDLQHQRLFALFNTLVEMIEAGQPSQTELQSVLRQLCAYVKNHFRFEETLMRSVGYPELKEHRGAHAKISERLKEYREKFHRCSDQKKGAVVRDVALFLQDWLQNHIKGEDQQYSPFLPITPLQASQLAPPSGEVTAFVLQPFHWDPRYSVGHDTIDAQHQRLFTIFNALIHSIAMGEGRLGVDKAFLQLRGYVKNHFRYEEALMKKNRYPDLVSHKEQHDQICIELKRYRTQFNTAQEADKNRVARDAAAFCSGWLQGHIKVTDKQYAPYVAGSAVQL
ncbi:MAG: bacteriohemerythrin [Magnetococcus sp. MYC-9]